MVSVTHSAIPLYLFAKAPVAGKAKKRMCPPLNQSQAAQLASVLLRRAVHIVETNWPGQAVLSATPDLQHKAFAYLLQSPLWQTSVQPQTDLGGRMAQSLLQGIEQAGCAAVLGTDIPAINGDILKSAYQCMMDGQQVVGPSADGGFYFLGLNVYPDELFRDIKWGSDKVYMQLMENAQACELDLKPLPVLPDCDNFADLQLAAFSLPDFANDLQQSGLDMDLMQAD